MRSWLNRYRWGLVLLALTQCLADAGVRAVVPAGFHQQPSRVPGPGLGDLTETALLAGARLRRDEPDVAHELPGAGEPLEIADLGAQPDRGQRVDPAQAPQPSDLHLPQAAGQPPDEVALELLATMLERVNRARNAIGKKLRVATGMIMCSRSCG